MSARSSVPPTYVPPVKVYSFPRSGTNLLMAMLKANFYSHIDTSVMGGWGHWADRRVFDKPVEYGKLFGNHFGPRQMVTDGSTAIYVMRDGRSVVASLYRSDGFLNPGTKPRSFTSFLNQKLDWYGSPGNRIDPPMLTPVQSWYMHVCEWRNVVQAGMAVRVRYEDLVRRPAEVMDEIAKAVYLPRRRMQDYVVVGEKVGPSPNEGDIRGWQKVFAEGDLDTFFDTVPRDCEFLVD